MKCVNILMFFCEAFPCFVLYDGATSWLDACQFFDSLECHLGGFFRLFPYIVHKTRSDYRNYTLNVNTPQKNRIRTFIRQNALTIA